MLGEPTGWPAQSDRDAVRPSGLSESVGTLRYRQLVEGAVGAVKEPAEGRLAEDEVVAAGRQEVSDCAGITVGLRGSFGRGGLRGGGGQHGAARGMPLHRATHGAWSAFRTFIVCALVFPINTERKVRSTVSMFSFWDRRSINHQFYQDRCGRIVSRL